MRIANRKDGRLSSASCLSSHVGIGSLRYHDGDGDCGANVTYKCLLLKSQRDDPNSLTLSNVGELPWSLILKKDI